MKHFAMRLFDEASGPDHPIARKLRELLDGKEHLAEDSGLGWIHHTRKCSFRNVNLSRSCLTLVLSGRKVLSGQEAKSSETLPSGCLVLFPAGENVFCSNMPEKGEYLALTLSFPKEMLSRVHQRVATARPRREPPEVVMLEDALERFLDALLVQRDALLAEMRQEQILYLLWKDGMDVFSVQDETIGRLRELVEADPCRRWTTEMLAEALCMSGRTLRRHLERSGTTSTELVRLSRLHVGLSLLQSRRMRVGEVARACGYGSQSRFAERFRERFGLNPADILATRTVSGAKLTGTGATRQP